MDSNNPYSHMDPSTLSNLHGDGHQHADGAHGSHELDLGISNLPTGHDVLNQFDPDQFHTEHTHQDGHDHDQDLEQHMNLHGDVEDEGQQHHSGQVEVEGGEQHEDGMEHHHHHHHHHAHEHDVHDGLGEHTMNVDQLDIDQAFPSTSATNDHQTLQSAADEHYHTSELVYDHEEYVGEQPQQQSEQSQAGAEGEAGPGLVASTAEGSEMAVDFAGPSSNVTIGGISRSETQTDANKAAKGRGKRSKKATTAAQSAAAAAEAAVDAAQKAVLEETERQLQKLNEEALPRSSQHEAGTGHPESHLIPPRSGRDLRYTGPGTDNQESNHVGEQENNAGMSNDPSANGLSHYQDSLSQGQGTNGHIRDSGQGSVAGPEENEQSQVDDQERDALPGDVRFGTAYARFVEEFSIGQGLIQPGQQSPMLSAWLGLTPQERERYDHLADAGEEWARHEGETDERYTTRLTKKLANDVRRVYETCHINYLLLCSPPFIVPPDFPVLNMSPPVEIFWQALRGGPAANLTKFLSLSHPAVTTRRLALPFGARSMDVKTRLNAAMRKVVREASGIADAEMKWTRPESLIHSYGVKLIGWPDATDEDEGVPLRNPSNNTAKQNRRLLEMVESGELHFVPASVEDRERVAAQMKAEAALRSAKNDLTTGDEASDYEEYEERQEDGTVVKTRAKKLRKTPKRIKRPRIKPILTLNPDGTIRHGGLEGRRRPGRPRKPRPEAEEAKPKKQKSTTGTVKKQGGSSETRESETERVSLDGDADEYRDGGDEPDGDVQGVPQDGAEDGDQHLDLGVDEGDGMYLPEEPGGADMGGLELESYPQTSLNDFQPGPEQQSTGQDAIQAMEQYYATAAAVEGFGDFQPHGQQEFDQHQ